MSQTTDEHRQKAGNQSATCGVLTVSDTRQQEDDKSGKIIIEALDAAGHTVECYQIAKDEPLEIDSILHDWIDGGDLDVICTTGGTGIGLRDTTIEVVRRLVDKELEGFGELFRMLSWDEVGAAAMLSRAIGGLAGSTLIFALPGSSNAVALAINKLIIPELPHLVWHRKQ